MWLARHMTERHVKMRREKKGIPFERKSYWSGGFVGVL